MRNEKSYCRLCFGFCGVNLSIDDDEQVVEVRGDHGNPATQGYICVKGLDITDGLGVYVTSENGRIPAIVKADPTLKRGVVSMTHGFGGMPDEPVDYRQRGASVSPLISLSKNCEPLQAMPRMSAVPVSISMAT
jgi:anaerobic selenocysteine-containing dehydrogenase